jgi:hypothetical protein
MFHSLKNLVLSMALAVTLCGVTAFGQPTSTAQSAMFNNTAAGTFMISGTEVWSYNKATAATYFSNTLTSGPVVSCGGNPNTDCASENQPPAPAVPAPDPAKLTPFVASNSCKFWNGTALTLNPLPQDNQYTQSVTISGLNGKGNWKFEWTYTIAFADSVGGPYAAKTAWDLDSSSSTFASVGVAGFFAGQSTQKKAKASPGNPWTFKASHTMTADDGSSRLVNPQYSILDSNGDLVCGPKDIAVLPIESGVDYRYAQNAGVNGSTNQLIDDAMVSAIQQGNVASPGGDKDNFAGNDYTNGERQFVDEDNTPKCSISQEGSYSLIVTGTLKGVSGTTPPIGFSTTSNVCISAGTCSVCP